jgi:hypothetical protein
VNELEELLSFLFGVFLISAVVLAWWFIRVKRAGRRDAAFQRVARALKGTLSRSDSLDPLSLQFTIEGRPAALEFERGIPPSTRAKVAMFRRSPGVCRILANHVAREQMKFVGARDIKIGDLRFDAAWFVTARPESFAHRIFAEDRRAQVIDSVRRLARIAVPSIEITRDTLIVRTDRILERAEELRLLAQTAIDFVGYILRLGPEEGIAWVAGEAEVGLCPVCASRLLGAVIFCDRCKTPQHEECWTYVGHCSTYACKGKRCVASG